MNPRVSPPATPAAAPPPCSTPTLRVGLVGPARTRNGLGPFLARHLAAAGAHVVAVAGREPTRTRAAAAALALQLEHDVAAAPSVDALVHDHRLDALVIASPIPAHLTALRLALAARLPTLCEKPLVDVSERAAARDLVAAFVAAQVPLLENCQWPFALAALRRAGVVPSAAATPTPTRFAMRLSPTGVGREMLTESLSHLLSLLQATLPLDDSTLVDDVRFESTVTTEATQMRLDFRMRTASHTCQAGLELVHCPQQPRPAWFALDGARFARELELPQYHWRFRHAQGTDSIGDPQADLVYSFVQIIKEPDLDLARTHAAAIQTRARLFADLVAAFDGRLVAPR